MHGLDSKISEIIVLKKGKKRFITSSDVIIVT